MRAPVVLSCAALFSVIVELAFVVALSPYVADCSVCVHVHPFRPPLFCDLSTCAALLVTLSLRFLFRDTTSLTFFRYFPK